MMSKTNTFRIFAIQSSRCFIRSIHNCESNRHDVDVLDEFTTQLVQKKSDKWDGIRNNKNVKYSNVNNIVVNKIFKKEHVNIIGYDTQRIDELLNETLEINDINKLKIVITQCISYNVVPSFKMTEKVISFCAQNGLKNIFLSFIDFIRIIYPQEYKLNSKFNHYLAEVYWLRGNITEALKLFEDVFVNNPFLRKKVKYMVKLLIINIVTQRSEGALVAVTQFTEKLAERYNDYFLLIYIWQSCFFSEWYTDQCTAANLLEKYNKLQKMIGCRIPYILHFAIREHKPEILHRFMEVLLKYEMEEHYGKILQTLFTYRYRNNDLRSCAEIIQWSLTLNVPLLSSQHEQFLALLLGHPRPTQDELPKQKGPDFQLKF